MNNYDGVITIGTDLETKKFEKKLKDLEKKADRKDIEIQVKEAGLEKQTRSVEKLNKKYEETGKRLDEIKKKQERLAELNLKADDENAKFTVSEGQEWVKLTNENLNEQEKKLLETREEQKAKIDEANKSLEVQKQKVQSLRSEYRGIVEELEEVEQEHQKINLTKIKGELKETGKSLTGIIKKVTRWSLALFGIRSAYNFIRQSMSTLSQYNEQLKTDLSYIRFAIASSMEQVIQKIIDLVYKLLAYINYVAYAWFRINLFANASAEAFKSASASTAEMKKNLAGFDEMNVLNDNGSTGVANAPSMDLSKIQNVGIPEWVQWIADNKDKLLTFFMTLGAVIAGIKIGELLVGLSNISTALLGLPLAGTLLLIGGIATAIVGVIQTVQAVFDFIENPTWENFGKILDGLAIAILGVAAAMIAFNLTNPIGWIVLAVGAVVGLAGAIIGERKELESSIETEAEYQEAVKNTKNAMEKYTDAFKNAEEAEKKLKELEEKHKVSGEELYKMVQANKDAYGQLTDAEREVLDAYIDNMKAQENLVETGKELDKITKEEERSALKNELAHLREARSFDEYKEAVVKAMEDGTISTEEARDYIEKAMKDMSGASEKTFMEDLPNNIKDGLNPNKYRTLGDKLSRWWNNLFGGFQTKLNLSVSTDGGGGSGGGGGFRKGGIAYNRPNLHYFASGGIINQPNRGVPIGIGGESGAEGILPLTDSQQMELLASTIGKYITINLTNVNQMNGRTISREIKRINNQDDFASNN